MKSATAKIYSNVTIEPAIVLFNFSDALNQASLDQLKIDKCCEQKFNYTDEICENLIDYEDENKLVQDKVTIETIRISEH